MVEAMIASGATHFEAAASTSRLSSTTSGTPSNTIPAPASAAAMFLRRRDGDAGDHRIGVLAGQQSEPRKACQRLPDFAECLGFECRELLRGARLDVDHGDGVAGIGKRNRDAATHAAGAETGDHGTGRGHRPNPSRNNFCNSWRPRPPRPRLASVRPPCQEVLAADRAADGEKSPRQRRCNAGQVRHRDQQRQAETQILAHVAMLGENDPLAPVAGIGQAVMRAAAIHPLLAFAGVMMRQRKMRTAIAEGLAHRDALGIERVGDAADRGLRTFLVNVPAFEMFDRAGIHHDQRRMNDRPGIHQRARQRVAAGLDHAGKRASDHVERVTWHSSAETRRPAAAWRGW